MKSNIVMIAKILQAIGSIIFRQIIWCNHRCWAVFFLLGVRIPLINYSK